MARILAVGELLIDFTPVKTKEGTCFKPNPGGAPCNMLAMAQSMGTQTAFIGKVGADAFGLQLKETLEEKAIDVSGLVMSEKVPTTLAFVHLTDKGDRSFSFYRDGCADVMLETSDVNFGQIDHVDLVHFGSLSFTNEPSKSTVLEILRYAKEHGKLISYDPNYRPALWPSQEEAIEGMLLGLHYADFLKVSDEEAELLTGQQDMTKAAEILYGYGLSLVTITLGDKGSLFYHESGCGLVEGFESQVRDTTGAGDSFFGCLIGQVVEEGIDSLDHEKLSLMVKTANAAASLVIEGLGGIPSIPTKEAVLKRLAINS